MNRLHILIQRLWSGKAPAALPQQLPVLSAADLKYVAGGAMTELPRIGGLLVAPPSSSAGAPSAS